MTEASAPLSEAQIAVHGREEGRCDPPETFIFQANATDPAMLARFGEENFPDCFEEYAELLHWDASWHTTLDTSHPPFWKWFGGGRLNASYNCVDRHLATADNKAPSSGCRSRRPRAATSSPIKSFTGGSTNSPPCSAMSATSRPATG